MENGETLIRPFAAARERKRARRSWGEPSGHSGARCFGTVPGPAAVRREITISWIVEDLTEYPGESFESVPEDVPIAPLRAQHLPPCRGWGQAR